MKEMTTKKAGIVISICIWVVAAIWFATGYIWGQRNALESVKEWIADKCNGVKWHLKREA